MPSPKLAISAPKEKTTTRRRATLAGDIAFEAYEIHLGTTRVPAENESAVGESAEGESAYAPFAILEDGTREGVRGERVMGTYLHGAFEQASVCRAIFGVPVDAGVSKAAEYDRLADWFDAHCRHRDRWLP